MSAYCWELCERKQIRGSIVVSISACHAEDPGSIPGRGVLFVLLSDIYGVPTWPRAKTKSGVHALTSYESYVTNNSHS